MPFLHCSLGNYSSQQKTTSDAIRSAAQLHDGNIWHFQATTTNTWFGLGTQSNMSRIDWFVDISFLKCLSYNHPGISEFDQHPERTVNDISNQEPKFSTRLSLYLFKMEEEKSKRSNYGVKQECKKGLAPEKTPFRIQDKIYREKYKTNVLPAIKQTLKDGWLNVRFDAEKLTFPQISCSNQDIALVPGHGPPIQTSSFLLASLSPWLRHLIQSAGEETCLCLPSVSSSEVKPT